MKRDFKNTMNTDIETFDNAYPNRDYTIRHVATEFTSLCPKTGNPDFGSIVLTYKPDKICIELKAYKLYLQAYRSEGIFYEALTNKILDDLVSVCQPRWMRIESIWKGRGGIRTVVVAEHKRPDYDGPVIPVFSDETIAYQE